MSFKAVKNRAPAPIQITAEQLLREAKERGLDEVDKAPDVHIKDREELSHYQTTKRKGFEDQLRGKKQNINLWVRYALWEASQMEFERARSVFERALDIDYKSQTLWLKYAEMEMKHKFINHARNIWDRCVAYLPRADVYWYKYTYMEELVGAIGETRNVFERWMRWEPDDNAWNAYVKFECRQSNMENAIKVMERYIACHPTVKAYLKYSTWLEKLGNEFTAAAREIYERALVELHEMEVKEKILIRFARFEINCKEYERARIIYKYALEQVEKKGFANNEAQELKQEYIVFEKKYGNRQGIEDAILETRRGHYQGIVQQDPYNYDAWFDYGRLEENEGEYDRIRAVYTQAVSNNPPINEKRYWRRYIFLWITYAIFEELVAKDVAKAREVHRQCIAILPNKKFTFGKIWLMAAHLEVRQKDLAAARKLLGTAIGMCPKENLFKGYIELELQLGEIERCRTIYAKYLEFMPANCATWIAFAQLEVNVGEVSRARAIYEIAVNQVVLDMPEVLWKSYIDFELSERQVDAVRALYERLLERTTHVKVWISYGQFEANEGHAYAAGTGDIAVARRVFTRGYDALKSQGLKEERVLLLQSWLECENKGSDGDAATVENMLPRKMKMKRKINPDAADGDAEWEEYYEYQFPDDEKKIVGLKLLETAMKWKSAKAVVSSSEEIDIDV